AVVRSIFVYPIKSCRGISLPEAPITDTGFRWDRKWLVVNSKGRAYTQRNETKLALVEVELPKDAFSVDWEASEQSFLDIKAPGMDILRIPLRKPAEMADDISVWEWSGRAFDEGGAAATWFSVYLGKPSRLVRFNDDSEIRAVDPEYAPGSGYKVMFSDGYPFLLVSQESLDALNALLEEPIPINRFRPNILVDGCKAFSEDTWTEIRINESTFRGVKLCARCKVPTINQETGVSGVEPTEALTRFRSGQLLLPGRKKHSRKVALSL
ncbi:hypothetical protein M569_17480, partial [Genlisea aurea]